MGATPRITSIVAVISPKNAMFAKGGTTYPDSADHRKYDPSQPTDHTDDTDFVAECPQITQINADPSHGSIAFQTHRKHPSWFARRQKRVLPSRGRERAAHSLR